MSTRPSTVDMVLTEARRRGISTRIFDKLYRGFYQLEFRGHRESGYFSSSQGEGYVAHRVFTLKALTTAWLREGGFPVPAEIFTDNLSAATEFLQQHTKIVVKPSRGTGGAGVTPGIMNPTQLEAAFAAARAATLEQGERRVVCQQHVEGRDFRVLVVCQQHVFAMERVPARVVGDGQHTVAELVAARNVAFPVPYHIRLDDRARQFLGEQGLSVEGVVKQGQRVQVAPVANAHAGGTVHDVTAVVHAEVKRMAIQVAEYFHIPVVGIDWITPDIQQPEGKISELNSTPDLTIHHFPDLGPVQNVVGAFVDMLFPETKVS